MIGQTISHYKITEKLGEGAMGVVYKAEDTKLERTVALKFLAAHLVGDAESRERFLREAKAAAALDHTNICTVYEIDEVEGQTFLAMAFIEGPSLKDKIVERPLKLDEALDLTTQTARGLQAAHKKGIAHRDIKPANLMLTEEGQVKIMDFGLAQLGGRTKLTKSGSRLGTPAYMSPEQTLGDKTDRRSDIWSLGVLLYEMVTGQQPFKGEVESAVAYSIVNQEPEPLTALRTGLPIELDRIVGKLLAKDLNDRYQHVDELLADLRPLMRKRESATNREVAAPARKTAVGWYVAGAMLVACLATLAWFGFRGPTTMAPAASLTPIPLTSYQGVERHPTFSPDGNEVAFSWNRGDGTNSDIYRKLIGPGGPLQLTTHPADEYAPSWSPDGHHIAFLRDVGHFEVGIFLVPPLGGPERPLIEKRASAYGIDRLAWSPDSQWLVFSDEAADDYRYALFLLSVATGMKRQITFPPESSRVGDYNALFSPDGRTLLFIRAEGFEGAVYSLALSEDYTPQGEPERVTTHYKPSNSAFWAPDGREIIFAAPEGLWRVAVSSPDTARPLAAIAGGAKDLVVARSGDRFAYSQTNSDSDIWLLEIPGPDGLRASPERFASSTRADHEPRWSPDGTRVAFMSRRSGNREIWVCDSDESNAVKVTNFGGRHVGWPNWSPDGEFLAFDGQGASRDIYLVNANGGQPRAITNHPSDDAVPSWSGDGKWIYFASQRTGDSEIWKIPVQGGEAVRLTTTGGRWPYESPDGKHVYYARHTGEYGLWRVPVDGGEPEHVLDKINGNRFTVGKRGIYFIQQEDGRRTLNLLNFATGETNWITDLQPRFVVPNVSPNGKRILGAMREETGSDLMLVENFR